MASGMGDASLSGALARAREVATEMRRKQKRQQAKPRVVTQ